VNGHPTPPPPLTCGAHFLGLLQPPNTGRCYSSDRRFPAVPVAELAGARGRARDTRGRAPTRRASDTMRRQASAGRRVAARGLEARRLTAPLPAIAPCGRRRPSRLLRHGTGGDTPGGAPWGRRSPSRQAPWGQRSSRRGWRRDLVLEARQPARHGLARRSQGAAWRASVLLDGHRSDRRLKKTRKAGPHVSGGVGDKSRGKNVCSHCL
jgi:hypothetical protein